MTNVSTNTHNVLSTFDKLRFLVLVSGPSGAGLAARLDSDLREDIQDMEAGADLQSADIAWALDILDACKTARARSVTQAVFQMAGDEWPSTGGDEGIVLWHLSDIVQALIESAEAWRKEKSKNFSYCGRASRVSFFWIWREAVTAMSAAMSGAA